MERCGKREARGEDERDKKHKARGMEQRAWGKEHGTRNDER